MEGYDSVIFLLILLLNLISLSSFSFRNLSKFYVFC